MEEIPADVQQKMPAENLQKYHDTKDAETSKSLAGAGSLLDRGTSTNKTKTDVSEWGLRINFVVKVGAGLSAGLGKNANIGLDAGSMGYRFSTDKDNRGEFLSMGIGAGIAGVGWEGPNIEGAANIKTLKLSGVSIGPTNLNVDRNGEFNSFSLGLSGQAVFGLDLDLEVYKKK